MKVVFEVICLITFHVCYLYAALLLVRENWVMRDLFFIFIASVFGILVYMLSGSKYAT